MSGSKSFRAKPSASVVIGSVMGEVQMRQQQLGGVFEAWREVVQERQEEQGEEDRAKEGSAAAVEVEVEEGPHLGVAAAGTSLGTGAGAHQQHRAPQT